MLISILSSKAGDWESNLFLRGILNWSTDGTGLIVMSRSLVAIYSSRTISLIVSDSCSIWAVNGDLIVVGSESVTMSVGVREQSSLEHLVVRGFNTWDNVGWSVSNLLGFCEIVLWVLVENEFSNRDKWIVAVRDNLGHIEDVELIVLSFLLRNELNVPSP